MTPGLFEFEYMSAEQGIRATRASYQLVEVMWNRETHL
jgi:hypothetical protein